MIFVNEGFMLSSSAESRGVGSW